MKILPRLKTYCLYDTFSTYYILGGMTGLYALEIWLSYFFINHFFIEQSDPGGLFLAATCIVPMIVLPIMERPTQAISRYLIRCRFDHAGIHCFGLFWGRFTILWNDIHTYGMFNSSYSYVAMDLFFLSTNGTEPDIPKKRTQVSRHRLVFQSRPELWPALSEYMPEDIKSHLQEAMRSSRACYMRR